VSLPSTCVRVAAALLAAGCGAGTPAAAPVASSPAVVTPSDTPSPVPTATVAPKASPSPITVRPTRTVAAAPIRLKWTSRTVTAADLPSSWRRGCPVAPAQLRLVTVPYLGFDGRTHRGDLVVHQRVAADVGQTFVRLRDLGFPIRSIRVIDEFAGSDDASMAADNTSGFNCRQAVGGSGWSNHAYGIAIDINPRENPYVYGGGTVAPPEGRAYVDRSPARHGMIVSGGPVVRAFATIGWSWGGYWGSSKDYQHFSQGGR